MSGSRNTRAASNSTGRSLGAGALRSGNNSVVNPGVLPTPPDGMTYVEDEGWSYTVHLPDSGWSKILNGTDPSGENYVPGLLKYDGDGDQYLYYIASITETNLQEGTEAVFALEGDSVLTVNDDSKPLIVTNVVPVKTHVVGTKVFTNGESSKMSDFRFTISSDTTGAPLPSVRTVNAASDSSMIIASNNAR
jgi:hypothetical protein